MTTIAIANATFAQLQAKAAELKLHEGSNPFIKYAVQATEAKPTHVKNLINALTKAGVTEIEAGKPKRKLARTKKVEAEVVEPVKTKRARTTKKDEAPVKRTKKTEEKVVAVKPKRTTQKADQTEDRAAARLATRIKNLRKQIRESDDAEERAALRKKLRAAKAKSQETAVESARERIKAQPTRQPKLEVIERSKPKLVVEENEVKSSDLKGQPISVKFNGDARAKRDIVTRIKIEEFGKGTKRDPKVRRRVAYTENGARLPLAEISANRAGKFSWNEQKLTLKVA